MDPTPAQMEGALVALAVIVVPGLLFWLWVMWLELRQTRDLADYYCEQWESAARRLRHRSMMDDQYDDVLRNY